MAGPTGDSGVHARRYPSDNSLDQYATNFRDIVRQRYFGQREKELQAAMDILPRLKGETASSAQGRSLARSKEEKLFCPTESTDGPDRAAAAGQPASAIGSGADSPQPKTDGADIASVKLEKVADTDAELERRAHQLTDEARPKRSAPRPMQDP